MITPYAQTPPSSPLHGEPEVVASELLRLLHPPLHHQQEHLLPVDTIRAQNEPATLSAGTENERLCNAFRLIIAWLASDWSPLAPMGPFSSSRGPSSISSTSAGTWHSSVTLQSAWLADLICPDISRLPCDSTQTSEAYTSVHCGPKVKHSIKTKLCWQSQIMTIPVTRNNKRDCLPLAGALNTYRSKPACWCLPLYEIAFNLRGKKQIKTTWHHYLSSKYWLCFSHYNFNIIKINKPKKKKNPIHFCIGELILKF